MKKRIICALCAASLLATAALAGCSDKDSSAGDTTAAPTSAEASQPSDDAASQATSSPQEDVKTTPAVDGLSGFTVTKEGSVNVDCSSVDITPSGIIYESNGKYGVVTPDGKKDTGAIYASAREAKTNGDQKGFIVVKAASGDAKNVNTCGLIDKDGNEIVPCQYANITVLNERYVSVVTADKETTDKDAAVVYFTDNMFSFEPEEGDTMYAGKWEVFDTVKKAMVPNMSGTRPGNVTAKGQFVFGTNDQGNRIIVDAEGKSITDGRTILSNGAYVLEINGKAAVYSTDDAVLFNYDAGDFKISEYKEPYYVGIKWNGTTPNYLLVNEKGEKVSAVFKGSLSEVTPDYVLSDEVIYKLDGTPAFNDRYSGLKVDKAFGDAYAAHKDNLLTIFDKTGKVLFSGDKEKDKFDYMDDFAPYQEQAGYNQFYYNYKEKAYTIQAYPLGSWFVETSGTVRDLVEIRSGSKLLDSSYGKYETVTGDVDKKQYIYAFNSVNGQVSDGSFDVFSVTAK